MSSTLLIRHLCNKLDVAEREDFLKYFGAQRVWFINPNSHTAFASFASKEAAEVALFRLHQLELLGKRLTVEYADEKKNPEPIQSTSKIQNVKANVENFKEFINRLHSSHHQINLCQPPPPNISYEYPSVTPTTLFNILYALAKNVGFYVQTLHLMNKMDLDPPFCDLNDNVKAFIKKCVIDADMGLMTDHHNKTDYTLHISSDESELSYEEDAQVPMNIQSVKSIRKRNNFKKINRKNIFKYNSPAVPNLNKKVINTEEVFEDRIAPKVKKIEINVNPTHSLLSTSKDNVEIVGEIGKINTPSATEEPSIDETNNAMEEECIITIKDLLNNKISVKDMKLLPVYKNYTPGIPSMRLYIKNLSKTVTSKDIEAIYRRYVSTDNPEDAKIFDVRVMQEGRMKGQAFVTLPSVEASQKALDETNGYILKDKPIVVQFARTANK